MVAGLVDGKHEGLHNIGLVGYEELVAQILTRDELPKGYDLLVHRRNLSNVNRFFLAFFPLLEQVSWLEVGKGASKDVSFYLWLRGQRLAKVCHIFLRALRQIKEQHLLLERTRRCHHLRLRRTALAWLLLLWLIRAKHLVFEVLLDLATMFAKLTHLLQW